MKEGFIDTPATTKVKEDLAAARLAIEELVGGLKPFADDSNSTDPQWDDRRERGTLTGMTIPLKAFRHAAALVARYGQ